MSHSDVTLCEFYISHTRLKGRKIDIQRKKCLLCERMCDENKRGGPDVLIFARHPSVLYVCKITMKKEFSLPFHYKRAN